MSPKAKSLYQELNRFTELIPDLPEELGLECLTRLPFTAHSVAARVCRRWRDLITSRELYYHRKRFGLTRKLGCLVQAATSQIGEESKKSGSGNTSYMLTVFDPVGRVWDRVDLMEEYPNGLPLFCQLSGCEGKLVVMGGWDPVSYDPITDVLVFDFAMGQWRRGKDMPEKRSFFAVGSYADRVYVAGGHDENKTALKTGWVYDLTRDEWTELPHMSQERDECEGAVIGDEFWVVSGYETDNQGGFDSSSDVYSFKSGQWRRVDGVWEAGRCPRSNLVWSGGRFTSWAGLSPAIQVGSCGLMLGGQVFVTGSEYQGGPNGFYVGDKDGEKVKLEKILVGDEFAGFVQSGCCVEI